MAKYSNNNDIHPAFKQLGDITDSRSRPSPCGRSGHSMCCDESNIYVYGGYSPHPNHGNSHGPRIFAEIWVYNIATCIWTQLLGDDIPDTCASSCMKLIEKRLWIYGGTGYPFGEKRSNTIKLCDCSKIDSTGAGSKWNLLEPAASSYNSHGTGDNLPPMAYGQSLVVHNSKVYIFGGAVGLYDPPTNDVHLLDLETRTWETLCPSGDTPNGKYKQETAQDEDRFYIFGGGRLHFAESLIKIHAYSFNQNTWESIKCYEDPVFGAPEPRSSFGLVQHEKDVYVFGGQFYSAVVERTSLDNIWRISLGTWQWQKLNVVLPIPVYFHTVTLSPTGYVYVFGGVSTEGQRLNNLYRWRLPGIVLKLSEICWELICRVIKPESLSKHCLSELGVPQRFRERLL